MAEYAVITVCAATQKNQSRNVEELNALMILSVTHKNAITKDTVQRENAIMMGKGMVINVIFPLA